MNVDALAHVVTLLQAILAMQAVALPFMFWIVKFLWRLERRVYTIELSLGIVNPEGVKA